MRFFSVKRLSSKRSSRSGLTLTEVAIVMGVVSVVLTAIWVGASSVWTNYNINRMQNQVFEIVQNFRQIYATRGMSWGDGTNITNTLRGGAAGDDSVYPQDVRNGSGDPRHAFGGAVQIFYQTPAAVPRNMRRIRLQLDGLSRDVCANFILKTPVLVRESGIVWIGGRGGSREINLLGSAPSSAVSLAEATSWCNGTDNTNWVGIEFKVAN